MKRNIFLLSLSLLSSIGAGATITIDGVEKKVDTLECRTIGPGIQYVRMNMPEYPLDVYTMTIDLNNPYNDVNTFIAREHAGSTEAMTSAYNRLSTPGHRTVGSVNGNFWIVSGQGLDNLIGQPHSGCMVNGEIVTEPNQWNRGRGKTEIEHKQDIGFVVIDQDKKAWIDDMNFEAKVTNAAGEVAVINEVNRYRDANEIVLYNRFSGKTLSNIEGTDVFISLAEGQSWGINTTVECVVTRISQGGGGAILQGEEYALSGNGTGAEYLNKMQVGDHIKISTSLTTRTDGFVPMARQMLTGNALVMRDGELTPRNDNETYNSQTYSRTGMGISKDGKTLYLIVIDYKSSTSKGTNTSTMCQILKQAGAWNVSNMDAGGSSQMMIRGSLVNNPADGKERPVSCGFMVFANAPDDNVLDSLAFDNYNLVVPSLSCFDPTILGYNRYGVLVDTDVQDYTLSCDASLGTISPDGKRFYAVDNTVSGYLHVTSGNASGKIRIDIKKSDILMKNPAVIADKAHPYPIEVISYIGENMFVYDPASLDWSVADPSVCAIESGVLTGLKNGSTRITGTIGQYSGEMDVTVEIPEAARIPADDFTGWTTKAISSITDAAVAPRENGQAELGFTYKSGRAPYVEMDKKVVFYSIPDTLRMLIESEIPVTKIQLAVKANGEKEQYPEYENIPTGREYLISIPISDITGENNRGGFPVVLNYIKFYIDAATSVSGQAYKIKIKELSLVYDNAESDIEHAKACDSRLRVYPNPVQGQTLYVTGEDVPAGSLVRLYDRTGSLALEAPLADGGALHTGNLLPGVYILSVQTHRETLVTKIVIQ